MGKSRFSLSFYFYALPITGLFLLGLVFLMHPGWEFRNKWGTLTRTWEDLGTLAGDA
ncbi:hypothetical protein [Puia sp.]|jgi:hypothetical protein|uniref:hypothetical protein n=1 Tax=Puia sp. TaxID=2045100 RepID=UPI002F416C2F